MSDPFRRWSSGYGAGGFWYEQEIYWWLGRVGSGTRKALNFWEFIDVCLLDGSLYNYLDGMDAEAAKLETRSFTQMLLCTHPRSLSTFHSPLSTTIKQSLFNCHEIESLSCPKNFICQPRLLYFGQWNFVVEGLVLDWVESFFDWQCCCFLLSEIPQI